MKIPTEGWILISTPMKLNIFRLTFNASFRRKLRVFICWQKILTKISFTCTATTDKTAMEIRLNLEEEDQLDRIEKVGYLLVKTSPTTTKQRKFNSIDKETKMILPHG